MVRMSIISQRIEVFCTECSEWIDEIDTEFEGIEEDFQGRDLLTFKCPDCKSIQTSYRVGK